MTIDENLFMGAFTRNGKQQIPVDLDRFTRFPRLR